VAGNSAAEHSPGDEAADREQARNQTTAQPGERRDRDHRERDPVDARHTETVSLH
jgi:hypothetical protein